MGGGGFLNTENNQNLEFSKESFGLNFLGKSYARFLSNQNANSWLKADTSHNEKEQNKNSKNLLIKGDNLEVLRHLQNAYNGEIKMIYIDPPYNTGGDGFVYNDDRKYSPEQIAKIANLDKDESKRLFKFLSKEQSSHSAWCVFMYPRLKIARNLLKDDGVIFISIDDNEQAVLKLLCDEVFGEENFISDIIWLKGNAQNDADNIQGNHEYILCYAKNIQSNPILDIEQEVKVKVFFDEKLQQYYYESSGITTGSAGGTLNARPNLGFSIYYNPKTKDFLGIDDYDKELAKINNDENQVYSDDLNLKNKGYVIIRPPKKGVGLGRWTWALEKFNNEKENILIKQNGNKFSVVKKEWLPEKQIQKDKDGELFAMIEKSNPPKSFIDFVGSGTGSKELKDLFNAKIFSNPKPTNLLKYLINLSTNPNDNDIILDFFAGSGTTAHAVMDLNAKDGGNRKFILVQLDEKIDEKKNKTAYDFCKNELKSANPTIFDITKERIIRAGKKIKDESVNLLNSELDLGFKIYEICENKRALPNDKLDDEISLFENLNELSDKDDLNGVLNAFRVYDRVKLEENAEILDLNGYEAYKFENKIYLINPNFKSENLKKLLEKIDNDKGFNPEKIVVYGLNFDSIMQREIAENIKNFSSKKELKIRVLIRY